jgi:phospholipase/carboxylesterase
VVLHGHDDDPATFARSAAGLAPTHYLALAPVGPVATAGGAAWFGTDDDRLAHTGDVTVALAQIDAIIDDLTLTRGLARHQVILGGFSQGAAVALLYALRSTSTPTDRLAGVFAVSGWLPSVEGVGIDPGLAADVAVLIGHGEDDDVVPLTLGRSVARLLDRAGATVTLVERPVGHEWAAFTDDIRRWLATIAPD